MASQEKWFYSPSKINYVSPWFVNIFDSHFPDILKSSVSSAQPARHFFQVCYYASPGTLSLLLLLSGFFPVTKLLNTAGNNTIKFPINAIMNHMVCVECTVNWSHSAQFVYSALYTALTVHCTVISQCTVQSTLNVHCTECAQIVVTAEILPGVMWRLN